MKDPFALAVLDRTAGFGLFTCSGGGTEELEAFDWEGFEGGELGIRADPAVVEPVFGGGGTEDDPPIGRAGGGIPG